MMRGFRVASLVAALAAILSVCCQQALAECGIASHYNEGALTATGERYNPMGVSAAHKTLPFGTIVRVTHKRTGRSIQVRINDRGPYIAGRIIDLSTGAKRLLGMDGLAPVCLDVVSYGHGRGVRMVSAHHGRRHFAHHHTRSTHYAQSRHHKSWREARAHFKHRQRGIGHASEDEDS